MSPNDPKEEVRSRVNRLRRQTHPDKGGDGEEFQRVEAAYKRVKLIWASERETRATDEQESAAQEQAASRRATEEKEARDNQERRERNKRERLYRKAQERKDRDEKERKDREAKERAEAERKQQEDRQREANRRREERLRAEAMAREEERARERSRQEQGTHQEEGEERGALNRAQLEIASLSAQVRLLELDLSRAEMRCVDALETYDADTTALRREVERERERADGQLARFEQEKDTLRAQIRTLQSDLARSVSKAVTLEELHTARAEKATRLLREITIQQRAALADRERADRALAEEVARTTDLQRRLAEATASADKAAAVSRQLLRDAQSARDRKQREHERRIEELEEALAQTRMDLARADRLHGEEMRSKPQQSREQRPPQRCIPSSASSPRACPVRVGRNDGRDRKCRNTVTKGRTCGKCHGWVKSTNLPCTNKAKKGDFCGTHAAW
eukprot:CAMPEP_0114621380 /NCGR_PEP_ID=MMETSP0168-20121206/9200_1 /TAXON_ID=95228 ORGANISM="Vannella sp., Strain DIVA3 517/6/12" /NCGR_SAMPLE_ID=MMETSP0168 /ASSEMBLY_ACC=CAM_ASM_000044 /LENGTH=451 /DNA_ID=CAMNT_0001832579 /DNA_START=1 /DNA_END=1356 /DNA_ORIENTATION=-